MRWKIFASSALGAVFGFAAVHELGGSPWSLFVGMLLGAIVGYIAVAPKSFLLGMVFCFKKAWQAAVTPLTLAQRAKRLRRLVVYNSVASFGAGLGGMVFACKIITGFYPRLFVDQHTITQAIAVFGVGAGFVACYFIATGPVEEKLVDPAWEQAKQVIKGWSPDYQEAYRRWLRFLKWVNPLSAFAVGIVAAPAGMIGFVLIVTAMVVLVLAFAGVSIFKAWQEAEPGKAVRQMWSRLCTFTRVFIYNFFAIVHTHARLTTAGGAAVGTALGVFFGSALIGALGGGVCGLLVYELGGLGLRRMKAPVRVKK